MPKAAELVCLLVLNAELYTGATAAARRVCHRHYSNHVFLLQRLRVVFAVAVDCFVAVYQGKDEEGRSTDECD